MSDEVDELGRWAELFDLPLGGALVGAHERRENAARWWETISLARAPVWSAAPAPDAPGLTPARGGRRAYARSGGPRVGRAPGPRQGARFGPERIGALSDAG